MLDPTFWAGIGFIIILLAAILYAPPPTRPS